MASKRPVINRTREEVLRKWVDALRSGKYRQTDGQLREYNPNHKKASYCCLGVLCDLATKDGGPRWDSDSWSGNDGMPPTEVQKFVGISQVAVTLASLNDDGIKFPVIATYIEKRLIEKDVAGATSYIQQEKKALVKSKK